MTGAVVAAAAAGGAGGGGAVGVVGRVWALAWSGFLQLARSRVYLNILVAGIGLVAAAGAFEQLSGGAGGRVLLDVGTAFVSLVVAALAGTIAVSALTRELETKQAHLVLARPIGRAELVVARFLTTAMLIVLANAVLGALLALLLFALGAPHAGLALAACLFASLEGFIVAAIAIFFGTGSSSTMSAVFTVTLFILGRLTGEVAVLLERGSFGSLEPVMRVAYALLPHLTAFDLTPLAHAAPAAAAAGAGGAAGAADDAAAVMGDAMSAGDVGVALVYGVAYAGAFLAAAAFRFSRRDLL